MNTQNDESQVKSAAGIVWFIGGLNLLLGILAVVLQVELLQNLGIGWFSIAFGLVFLALGFFVRRRSVIALILAILVFGLDALLGIVNVIAAGATPAIGGLAFRAFLLYAMIRAVGPMQRLNRAASTPPTTPMTP